MARAEDDVGGRGMRQKRQVAVRRPAAVSKAPWKSVGCFAAGLRQALHESVAVSAMSGNGFLGRRGPALLA